MKLRYKFSMSRLHRSIVNITIMFVLTFLSSCNPGATPVPETKPPKTKTPTSGSGVQISNSGWEAQRFLQFDEVWASTDNSDVMNLEKLDNTFKDVVLNGYVTTEKSTTNNDGQGRVKKDTCTYYIYKGGFNFNQETINTCTRESTGTWCSNISFSTTVGKCEGLSVITLPATIDFQSSAVTIIEYRDIETVVIISYEGTVLVTPTDQEVSPFEVSAEKAAYAVNPEFRPEVEGIFGFPPGDVMDFELFVDPIIEIDQTYQVQSIDYIQRTNSILLGQGLPIFPLSEPYRLGIQWLNEENDDIRFSQAIAQMVNWNDNMINLFPTEVPILFATQGEIIDLRSSLFDPENSLTQFDEVGYSVDQGMILVYDASIPNLAELATIIGGQIQEASGINLVIQEVNPDSAMGVFPELKASESPVLLLSGF